MAESTRRRSLSRASQTQVRELYHEVTVISRRFRTSTWLVGQFIRVTAKDWHRVKNHILRIERASFVHSIMGSEHSLREAASSSTAITLLVVVERCAQPVAYAMANKLEEFDDLPGAKDDLHQGHEDTMYLSSVAVAREWRKRGLGSALEREVITIAHNNGFPRITAHIRSSAHLDNHITKSVLHSFPNWYGTGEAFDYVELDLKSHPT
jgi:GNAT superfamily N-acetyltransferase